MLRNSTTDIARKRERQAATGEEIALVGRVASGDRAAFETLYRGYHPRLTRFLERVTRRPHLVDELVNDTMLVVWRKAHTFNLRSQVSTWILGIAIRRALKALKRVDDAVDFDPESAADTINPGPESAMQQVERSALLDRALAALSADHRAVIQLTYYEGRSCKEVAAIMDCPVDTVKTRMFHARRRLRVLIADQGEGEP